MPQLVLWLPVNVSAQRGNGQKGQKWEKGGSVAEWSKALVLGTSLSEARVRIPPLSSFCQGVTRDSGEVHFSSLELFWPLTVARDKNIPVPGIEPEPPG